jgi:hypothetical protein
MSNNAPDYEDNLVFPPQDDQIVGEPEGEFKKSTLRLSEAKMKQIKQRAAAVTAAAVQAATFEMRDQLTIVRSANHVLKEERKVLLSIIKACFPYVALHSTLEAEALQERIREALS